MPGRRRARGDSVGEPPPERDHLQQLGRCELVAAAGVGAEPCTFSTSPIAFATVSRGSSDEIGILEDELDLAGEVAAVSERASACADKLDGPRGRRLQPDEQPRERRLAAAALADDPECPARLELDRHAAQRLHGRSRRTR